MSSYRCLQPIAHHPWIYGTLISKFSSCFKVINQGLYYLKPLLCHIISMNQQKSIQILFLYWKRFGRGAFSVNMTKTLSNKNTIVNNFPWNDFKKWCFKRPNLTFLEKKSRREIGFATSVEGLNSFKQIHRVKTMIEIYKLHEHIAYVC